MDNGIADHLEEIFEDIGIRKLMFKINPKYLALIVILSLKKSPSGKK